MPVLSNQTQNALAAETGTVEPDYNLKKHVSPKLSVLQSILQLHYLLTQKTISYEQGIWQRTS